ncbi:Coenzyme Q-binding protein COQ10 B, mitochondrial [Grifola frondosa]|uniref:Coenzyme Q-binding protein COQ10 B, mitochondrial n=1 Tax=Grifola frondosa TaxID=5627 RepID=A0A1C7LZV7_GRIFR|nr:Coenzyme Q-binding protein COQ10 B, mitochondrial [Grifola frondosa]
MALLTRLPLLPSSRLHRSLFTFPDLSSLSPFSDSNGNNNQQPHTYHERKILPYRPSELYNVVADATSYPRFLPFCTDARILGNSKGVSAPHLQSNSMDVELTVGFLSFKERYVSKVTCRPHESVEAVACSSTPLFKTLNTVWRFQPASPKSPHPSSQLPRLTSVPAQSEYQSNFSHLGHLAKFRYRTQKRGLSLERQHRCNGNS